MQAYRKASYSLKFGQMVKLKLAEVLKKKRLSKRQFAKRLKVAYSSVFRYFRKGYDPKLSTLHKWAKVLNCRISDLYSEK